MKPVVLRINDGSIPSKPSSDKTSENCLNGLEHEYNRCNGTFQKSLSAVESHNLDCELITGDLNEIFSTIKNIITTPGGLVAIPTETVYGLAGNIYLEESLKKIFLIKNRPFNDPLIVHVDSFMFALKELYDVNIFEAMIILHLSTIFTPGPLTMVAKCKSSLPTILTNDTAYLAVRCPSNELCLSLIRYLNIPLAAPSANKFGHISPTCAEHVVSEFSDQKLHILDGGQCHIGIESTVIKISTNIEDTNIMIEDAGDCKDSINRLYEELYDFILLKKKRVTDEDVFGKETAIKTENDNGSIPTFGQIGLFELLNKYRKCTVKVEILRKGAVSFEQLKEALSGLNNVVIYQHGAKISDSAVETVADGRCFDKFESPGMYLTHYAPNVPTYLVQFNDFDSHSFNLSENVFKRIDSKNIVMIDIGHKFNSHSSLFKTYISLSNEPSSLAKQLYSILRRAESHALPAKEDSTNTRTIIAICFKEENVELYSAIYDRITRSTSGRFIYPQVSESEILFYIK